MSGVDGLCECLAVFFSCCCIGCNEASGLWCFYKSCSCRSRRGMDDGDFERAVEELYSNKLNDPTHDTPQALELQPRNSPDTGASDGTTRVPGVNTQPAPRRSMNIPGPRPDGERAEGADGQRNPTETRAERKERTREWVHAHSVSEPGVAPIHGGPPRLSIDDGDGGADRSGPREHQRSKSHAGAGASIRTPGGSMRERARGAGQPTSDAQTYVRAVEQAWRRSEDNERTGGADADADAAPRAEPKLRVDATTEGVPRAGFPPRLDIPAALRPGRPLSFGAHPAQAAGETTEQGGADAKAS